MSTRKQFNFRVPEWLLERVREQAKAQGITITEWLENACLNELGMGGLATPDRLTTLHDKDRIKRLEQDVKQLKEAQAHDTEKLSESIDQLWDTQDYIARDSEKNEELAECAIYCLLLMTFGKNEEAQKHLWEVLFRYTLAVPSEIVDELPRVDNSEN